MKDLSQKEKNLLLLILALIIVGGFGYLGYENYKLKKELLKTQTELASTTQQALSLGEQLMQTEKERDNLQVDLDNGQALLSYIEGQFQDISGTVGTLDKLSKTDPELLQKYSKVFFLNENYFPPKMVLIKKEYTTKFEEDLYIREDVSPYLENLIKNASANNVDIRILSAFRSFDTQAQLKSTYSVIYGADTANSFSADQGYSEHQLGTTVDFTTSKLGSDLSSFDGSEAYTWLTENAYRYGFVLSYPEDNSYYRYEPWHWRFVGKKLAYELHRTGKYFYNLDQREIDEYLVSIFD